MRWSVPLVALLALLSAGCTQPNDASVARDAADAADAADGGVDPGVSPQAPRSSAPPSGHEEEPASQPSQDPDGPREATWWHRTGFQCTLAPWEAAGGQRPAPPPGVYVDDPARVRLVEDHYAPVVFDEVHAYLDDLAYPQACGERDGLHYWVRADPAWDGAGDGWARSATASPI